MVVVLMVGGLGCADMRVNNSVLFASSALLVCDWSQTRQAAQRGWHVGDVPQWEGNPMLGRTPSAATVDAYFGATIVLNAALWYLLPDRWKAIGPGAVIGVEAKTIRDNVNVSSNKQIIQGLMRRDGITHDAAAAESRRMHSLCGI